MTDRLFSAFWVPVVVIIATAALIIGIGELLLALAHVQEKWLGVKEPLSVIVAMVLAAAILLGATWIAKERRRPQA